MRVLKWSAILLGLAVVLVFGGLWVMKLTIGGGHYSMAAGSMMPALRKAETVIATPFSGDTPPRRGAIVVFGTPADQRVEYIKRVIGLPGERVAMRGGVPVIDGQPVDRSAAEPFLIGEHSARLIAEGRCTPAEGDPEGTCRVEAWTERLPGGTEHRVLELGASRFDDFAETEVPASHVFVLGDNRDNSLDSRNDRPGMIPVANITGIVRYRLVGRSATGYDAKRSMSPIE